MRLRREYSKWILRIGKRFFGVTAMTFFSSTPLISSSSLHLKFPGDWYNSVSKTLSISLPSYLPENWLLFSIILLRHRRFLNSFSRRRKIEILFLKTHKNGMINNDVVWMDVFTWTSWKMSYHSGISREFVSVLDDKKNIFETLTHQNESYKEPTINPRTKS